MLKADQKDLAAVPSSPRRVWVAVLKLLRSMKAPGLPLPTVLLVAECELVGQVKHGTTPCSLVVKSATLLEDGEALTMASTGWNYGG